MGRDRRPDVKRILADPDLRRKLMVSTIQATQAREGIETTEEQADRAYYVVTEGERAAFFDLERFREGKADRRHEMLVIALRGEADRVRFDVARRDFSAIEGAPLAYQRIGLVAHIFRETPKLDPTWGIAVQGLATANDSRFVRCWWEIPRHEIGADNGWVRFAKGGEFCRLFSDVYLVVLWNLESRKAMSEKGRVQNVEHYFKAGLTWPRRTAKGFNLRRLPEGCIFADKGPALFLKNAQYEDYFLGICNSALFEYLFKAKTSFSWEVGIMKSMPIPKANPKQHERISNLAKSIYNAKVAWDKGNEISTRFTRPSLLREEMIDPDASVNQRLEQLAEFEAVEDARIQQLYAELNDEVYRLYGIPAATRRVIEETLGERPPEIIWPQMEGRTGEQKRIEHVWRLLSYVVKRVVEADEDGIVPLVAVAGESNLLDRVYRELEVIFSGHSVSQVEVEIVNELKGKVKGYRSVKNIQVWLEDVFFQYHVSLYKNRPIIWHISSVQGKGAAAFGALVHYHKFDKNGMAKLRGAYLRDAIEFFRREAALAAQEQREGDRLDWQAKLEEAQDLDRRLQLVQEGHHEGPEGGDHDFRILTPWKSANKRPKGWDPDLDDGVKVNIEPLQKARVLRLTKVV